MLILLSQEAGQVVWYSHLLKNFPQFVVIHTVRGFGVVNEADVFLEFLCFFDDPVDVSNLISGSCAFSKASLNIWMFIVHVLLKSGLENFKHYFTLAPHERLTDLAVVPREKAHTGAAAREQPQDSPVIAR